MMWSEGGQPALLTFAGLRGGGKSGGQSSSQNQQTSTATSGTTAQDLPPWLTGAAQQAVGTAQTLSQNPNLFNQYPGQQVADVGAGTQAAWNAITGGSPAQTAGQIGQAAGTILGGVQGAAGPQQQAAIQGGLSNAAGLLGQFSGLGPATAGQIGANAQTLMSPYAQSVIAPTMALGQQALAQNLQQIGAGANQAGAFGGSRQGVMEGVAQAQTALGESQQLGNMLNTGWNAALNPAANVALQAGQQGYGASGLLAQGQIAGGQQLGQDIQGQALAALSAGQGLPEQQIQNLSAIGAQQQSQQQALLNAQMGNYYGAQQQPIQNLDVLLSTLGGVPYGTTTTQNASNLAFGNQSVANQRNPLTGALGGAATGAAIGSAIPGVGTAIGALGGGLLGAFG
jgi:hypothetical protein